MTYKEKIEKNELDGLVNDFKDSAKKSNDLLVNYKDNYSTDKENDIEIIFNLCNNGLEMYVEIDRKLKGIKGFFLECLDLDERVIRIRFDGKSFENDNGEIQDEICNKIMQYAQA